MNQDRIELSHIAAPDAALADEEAARQVPLSLPDLALVRTALLAEYPMATARMVGDELVFDDDGGFKSAMNAGFFLMEIPGDLGLDGTDLLCAEFFKDRDGSATDPYRGFREVEIPGYGQGYFDRPHDQLESFFVGHENWSSCLPLGVAAAGPEIARVATAVLKSVLREVAIPEPEWARLVGNVCDGGGHRLLGFNHFRPEKPMRGSRFHRDGSWVTVLRSTRPGLVSSVDGKVYAINPRPGYFIINFGSALEILTGDLPTPVKAHIHGVARSGPGNGSQEGRTSYAMCLYSDADANLYRYADGQAIFHQTVLDYFAENAARVYDAADGL
jgi:hypothetical protein